MSLKKFADEFKTQVEALLKAKNNRRLAHSFLVYSDDPVLKDKFALALSKLIACISPDSNGYPCAKCKICRQIQEELYSELFILRPLSKSRKIEVGKDRDDIGTVRWFEGMFYFTSAAPAGVKIGIIYDADCMTFQAQNAFLKTLEEPPANSFFILTTTKQGLLLPTIKSRCQRVYLFRNRCIYSFPYKNEISQILYRLVFETHGNIGEAEICASELIDVTDKIQKEIETEAKNKKNKSSDEEYISSAMKKAKEEQLNAAVKSEYLKVREEILSYIHTWFAHHYMLASGIDKRTLSNPEIFSSANSVITDNYHLTAEQLLERLNIAENLIKDLRWNVNNELAFRNFCYNI